MHPLVSQLTEQEKISLLSGGTFWTSADVERLDVVGARYSDGPHGLRYQAAEADHLGLNNSEPATAFPTGAATGSTWNPELLREIGVALGRESRARGVDVLLGPGVNIKRSPLCGRNFEYFSEDPLLSGELGRFWVDGVQSQGVGASVKHFAANNQETERMRVSAEVDERTLREIYFPAFERVVRAARPASVMCAYNAINGVPASESRWLLTDVLRADWGFDGYVVSDWGAVRRPAEAVAAGTDVAMPSADSHAEEVQAALDAGALDLAAIDEAVSRVLSVHDRVRATRGVLSDVDLAEHHALAKRAAIESMVLLVNEGGVLPLSPTAREDVVVIGEFARTPRYQGAGSSHVVPTRLDTLLGAISSVTPRSVRFAPGFRLDGVADAALVDEAVRLVSQDSTVILMLGLPEADESEGFDRDHLRLPTEQLELLRRIAAVTDHIVVVLSNGSVVELEPIVGRARAVLETWLGGQASGAALAEVLFGVAEPSGRLAETIPIRLEDTPAFVNWPGTSTTVIYGERIYVGYRWYDRTRRDVAFEFGHGLGYTTFSIEEVSVSIPDPTEPLVWVEASVRNTGERVGSEVVQVYVGDVVASLDRPLRELKAFEKVELGPGETRRMRLLLDQRAFAFWGPSGWTVEPGTFRVEVGTSSRQIVEAFDIELDVPMPVTPLRPDSTLEEWFRHPVGGPLVNALFVRLHGSAFENTDEALYRMALGMPLNLILDLGGTEDAETVVARLLQEAHG
ncbi:glycoside hydrolase family 3 C-terminal domain-containing protein [Amnibacterium flavum]|uniref:Exo-alpha-(1->6)-L-arabinopyranosidase n=1 Tax=Amnibacterium flavum TaxID=2173173 RepID=A0A2V1HQK0_9MICO|nr:glycoside hydrolase family 3 N-terminal domain-containing protein [Amnibacterium flavum]PVZ93250.1 glycosyl hydrolase [Amnibacterium flavum]